MIQRPVTRRPSDLAAGVTRRESRRRNHKLDPYKALIDDRLREFPRLSARQLFDEVRATGYPGGYGRVGDYVRMVRPRDPSSRATGRPGDRAAVQRRCLDWPTFGVVTITRRTFASTSRRPTVGFVFSTKRTGPACSALVSSHYDAGQVRREVGWHGARESVGPWVARFEYVPGHAFL